MSLRTISYDKWTTDMLVQRIIKHGMAYRKPLVLIVLLSLCTSAAGVGYPLIYRALIDDGILGHRPGLVLELSVLLGLAAVADAVLKLAIQWVSARLGGKIVLNLRSRMFERMQHMPIAFFARARTGALMARLNDDVVNAQVMFTSTVSLITQNSFGLIGTTIALCVLSWQVALISLAVVPLFVLSARWTSRRTKTTSRDYYRLNSDMNSLLSERLSIAGATLAKLYDRSAVDRLQYLTRAAGVRDAAVAQSIYSQILTSIVLVSGGLLTALAYGWGGLMSVRGTVQLGTVVALTAYLVRLYGPFTTLATARLDVTNSLVSFDRIFEILDLQPAMTERVPAIDIPAGAAAVEFEHVRFRYPSEAEAVIPSLGSEAAYDEPAGAEVLRDVSFTALPGQMLALVGPSGAGKTTITQLLCRLYDPQSGAVRINGVDVRGARLESLRRCVGVVSQDSYMFHDTIRQNLRYGDMDAPDAVLFEALRTAQLLELVTALPTGLDTVIGDHGYRLSGGERQRLAIARMLVRQPQVVVLDEATAHLDAESQAAVWDSLRAALAGRTLIVATHRLSTIRNADVILLISGGRVLESGNHDELMKLDGAYATLYRHPGSTTLTEANGAGDAFRSIQVPDSICAGL
jgi:ATP-binding cassette subfamily B protein